MSDKLAKSSASPLATVPSESLQDLKDAYDRFSGALNRQRSLHPVERAMLAAEATTALRVALSGPVLDHVIMPLMNTQDGFDTDRNPRKHKPWMNGDPPKPYDKEVVLDCAVSAILRGLPLVGNTWNIIADTMYPRKEGFEYLVGTVARYSVSCNVPPISDELYRAGGYVRVTVTVKYVLHSEPDTEPRIHSGVYSVRLNKKNAVGVEACEGKAKRKALRDLWLILSGVLLPDADDLEEGPSVHQVGGTTPAEDLAPVEPPPDVANGAKEAEEVAAQLAAWRSHLEKLGVRLADVRSWLDMESLPPGLWKEEDRKRYYDAAEAVAEAKADG